MLIWEEGVFGEMSAAGMRGLSVLGTGMSIRGRYQAG